MEQILPKVPGIISFIDNIFIAGKDDEEHLHRLDLVLKSFKENGLSIEMSKCHFLQSSVQYLGTRGHPTLRVSVHYYSGLPLPQRISVVYDHMVV